MIKRTKITDIALQAAYLMALERRSEYVTPEHLLYAGICDLVPFRWLLENFNKNVEDFKQELEEYINQYEKVPGKKEYELLPSNHFTIMMGVAQKIAENAGKNELGIHHLILGMFELPECMASTLLKKYSNNDPVEFMDALFSSFDVEDDFGNIENIKTDEDDDNEDDDNEDDNQTDDNNDDDNQIEENEISDLKDAHDKGKSLWTKFVTCINDQINNHNPLIGRELELERTMQILCRKQKNNPIHIGESGVGKTSIVYGLAKLIEDGNVPERLKGCKIYQLDLGSLIAGSQFRGDFEKRIKIVMDGVMQNSPAIVYIDEIHQLIGAGQTGESTLDASEMLKPYMDSEKIKFIGSTTFQEYSKYFQKNIGLTRRFQTIEILEPSVDETVKILDGLINKYEDFHKVKYAKGVTKYAAEVSAKFINDRFLPDKAIDLIDEAGAYREMHPITKTKSGKDAIKRPIQIVDKELISEILSKICKVEAIATKNDDEENLKTLSPRILSQIYGQDTAVKQVVEAVQMSKAGLLDDSKPIASLLFVGPTGVGKTEVAKVLSEQLGLKLIRFDMSEYTEKHTVAKLIGSPAGYVGYEEGGLLTDAIRKTPNCVLLLDEIEKAHSDIYNILLQVMDYASLTDNKGRKADFRHVILIMTSNAGAQYASQANVGFTGGSTGNAMLTQVKKTFKPEFINRLTSTVVFNDLDKKMAELILNKKIMQLQNRLNAKNVKLKLSEEAFNLLLDKGFSKTYGARELERTINSMLNPILMNEILFGCLKKGGEAIISVNKENSLIINNK
ncbi:MAG: AAA family ATPase [Bacteroidales bacterium]|nr:AAA family ATPase [Bacteroidales bacterium]